MQGDGGIIEQGPIAAASSACTGTASGTQISDDVRTECKGMEWLSREVGLIRYPSPQNVTTAEWCCPSCVRPSILYPLALWSPFRTRCVPLAVPVIPTNKAQLLEIHVRTPASQLVLESAWFDCATFAAVVCDEHQASCERPWSNKKTAKGTTTISVLAGITRNPRWSPTVGPSSCT